MICPYCSSDKNKVVDKRPTESDTATRRRRECIDCEKRFTTYERIETFSISIMRKEPFDIEKVQRGILRACEKRPVSLEEIDKITSEVDSIIKNKESTNIHSSYIGRLVMSRLKKLDKVSYIRFASVYKDFKDPEEFQEALNRLVKE